MSLLFHRGFLLSGSALARITLATAAAATMLSISSGLQGCIENPGADHRLNHGSRDYHVIATARYAEESVLELSVKRDSGVVSLRILSIAREPIDSAAFLLQFGDRFNYSGPRFYHRDSKLSVIVRIGNLQPGEVLEYGAISRDVDLGDTFPTAKLIRFADGAPRGNPLGGVYSGNYSLIDTAGRRSMGPLKGIITVEGEYQFFMETGSGRGGIDGYLHGRLDSARTDGFLIADSYGGSAYPTTLPSPFTLDSVTVKGTFLSPEMVPWFDSLDCELQPMRLFWE